MEEKKNNKGAIVLICILCMLVSALGSYIVYDNIVFKQKNNNQNS